MPNPICSILKKIPEGTVVKELMMNGEDVSKVEKFVKYDRKNDLAYFTNTSDSIFVAVGKKIDMIEFHGAETDMIKFHVKRKKKVAKKKVAKKKK